MLDSLAIPIVGAPMAGGASTPELAAAVSEAGGLGFVASGYKTPEAMSEAIAATRALTSAPFGINVFLVTPTEADPAELAAFRERLGDGAGEPRSDDDGFAEKVRRLLEDPVPVVSFTFGIPDAASLAALRDVGTLLVQTVTSVEEAGAAVDAGVEAVAVQAAGAGGHSGTLTPDRVPPDRPLTALVSEIRAAVALPILAAGGLASAEDVAAVLAAGADAAVVGTVLLLADESGASAAHRAGLLDHSRETAVMRAWTGRPARGLRNAFSDAYDAVAPTGYPAVHHLTRPLRRAAASAADPERVNLWAGTGFRAARQAPVSEILRGLA